MSFKKLLNYVRNKTNGKNEYVFDAEPDFPRSDSNLSSTTVPDNASENDSNTKDSGNEHEKDYKTTSDDQGRKPNKPDRTHEEESNFSTKDKEEFFEEPIKKNSTGASNIQHTNMVFNGCSKIQIGNTYKQVNVGNYTHSQPSQNTGVRQKKFQKTEAIKGLLKSKDILETAHITCLSTHFGSKWRAVGSTLELTEGELDSICERYEGHEERGFQMLRMWWQKRGEGVTVGELAKRLWEGDDNTGVAREAVHKLSVNIENLK